MKTGRPQVLITAGNTRESIDSVRWWSNIFTGQTGLDIAYAISAVADVCLLTSNLEHVRELTAGTERKIEVCYFQSHADLMNMIPSRLSARKYDAVFMTAAVSDYIPDGAYAVLSRKEAADSRQEVWTVQKVQQPKVSSAHQTLAIIGKPTAKVIDQFRTVWKYRGLLFKFKLEVDLDEAELITVAQASREHSMADVIVANTLEMVHGPEPSAIIIDSHTTRKVPRSKLAQALKDELVKRLSAS